MTKVCYSACNPFTMVSEGLYTSQTRHMTIFIQNCDGHTGLRPTEAQRSRAVTHGLPGYTARRNERTITPGYTQNRPTSHRTLLHTSADQRGCAGIIMCGRKGGKKSHVSFRASSVTGAIRSLKMVHGVRHSKRARIGTCVHAHPSAFSVRPFVPSVRPSVCAHLAAWPGLFTATTVALRGSWR